MWNEAGAAPVPAREPATLRDADPPQPLKQHRSHCSQSPAHHGRQRCNQLLKHLNAHAKGSLQNQVLLFLTKRQVAGLSE